MPLTVRPILLASIFTLAIAAGAAPFVAQISRAADHRAAIGHSTASNAPPDAHAELGHSGADKPTVASHGSNADHGGSVLPVANPRANAVAGHGTASSHSEAATAALTEMIWLELAAGNQRFVAGTPRSREFSRLRQELAAGQHPKAIILGCADSRVSPELLFDQSLGDLFVVRTAGNIADPIALGSIEYAIEHLHVNLVVVLGHEACGAVKAAAAGGAMPTENLNAIVKQIEPALAPLRATLQGDDLARAGVSANVHQSLFDIVRNSPILLHALIAGEVRVIGGVYDLDSGEVQRLN